MLRRSELTDIQISDLTRDPDSSGRFTIHRSKTDQFGESSTLYVGASTMNLIDIWINRAGIIDGALFRSLNKAGIASTKPLSAQSVGTIIKQSAQSIGIEGASGHSLRVGSAQELVRNGATLAELMQSGRWTSERMPAHYAKAELAGRGAIARLKHSA